MSNLIDFAPPVRLQSFNLTGNVGNWSEYETLCRGSGTNTGNLKISALAGFKCLAATAPAGFAAFGPQRRQPVSGQVTPASFWFNKAGLLVNLPR